MLWVLMWVVLAVGAIVALAVLIVGLVRRGVALLAEVSAVAEQLGEAGRLADAVGDPEQAGSPNPSSKPTGG